MRSGHPIRRTLAIAAMAALLPVGAASAAHEQELAALPLDLTQLSLEDLMKVEVTSVSKRAEPMFEAAAAVFVLSGDDIRRSGARSIAETLRMVPGLHVARTEVQTQTYAITARGFNNGTADKLEVLLDGRSVYSPLFSGVFWDVLDTYLPDIDRIEVIRGPGAALWGANAVNGVINIVTRAADQTQGTQLVAGGGTEERAFGAVRSGGRFGEHGSVRVYAQALERDGARRPNRSDFPDILRLHQAGLRADWNPAGENRFTLMGDVYAGERENATGDIDLDGGNVLARWERRLSAQSALSVKAYYDRYSRAIPQVYREERNTGDIELQHELRLGTSQQLVYGLGYRNTSDRTGGPPLAFTFDPAQQRLETYSAFVQDQITLADGRGNLTLGSKFEHNDYSGVEVQPSVRLGWRLNERWFTWGAVSRAVRSPNRFDTDIGVRGMFRIGNPEFDSEKLIAYESGLRFWNAQSFSADLALFYNDYDDLRSAEPAPHPFGTFGNKLEGHGAGAELNLTWRPMQDLQLRPFYAFLDLELESEPGSADRGTALTTENSNPRHNAGLDLSWQPGSRWSVDALLRHVSKLPASRVPAYTDLSLRAGWKASPAVELALVGTNLLDRQHPEFGIPNVPPLELERGVFAELRWSWD